MAKKLKPIACYMRISTVDQTHDSQKQEIQKWLTAQGMDVSQVDWYQDTESGRKMDRPALDRLTKAIHGGHVKTVVVYKLDRLARRMLEGLNLLCDWAERGVRIVSVTQQIDVSGAMGRMVASLMLGVAEIEWEYRRDRQTAGIEAAKAKGVYAGRKVGSTKGNPARAKELKEKGLTADEIATSLGCSVRSVWRYLNQEV